MRYIEPKAVRRYVNGRGKRVSPGFLYWLDAKVERILDRQIEALGGRGTLNVEDAAAVDAFRAPTMRKHANKR